MHTFLLHLLQDFLLIPEWIILRTTSRKMCASVWIRPAEEDWELLQTFMRRSILPFISCPQRLYVSSGEAFVFIGFYQMDDQPHKCLMEKEWQRETFRTFDKFYLRTYFHEAICQQPLADGNCVWELPASSLRATITNEDAVNETDETTHGTVTRILVTKDAMKHSIPKRMSLKRQREYKAYNEGMCVAHCFYR